MIWDLKLLSQPFWLSLTLPWKLKLNWDRFPEGHNANLSLRNHWNSYHILVIFQKSTVSLCLQCHSKNENNSTSIIKLSTFSNKCTQGSYTQVQLYIQSMINHLYQLQSDWDTSYQLILVYARKENQQAVMR